MKIVEGNENLRDMKIFELLREVKIFEMLREIKIAEMILIGKLPLFFRCLVVPPTFVASESRTLFLPM